MYCGDCPEEIRKRLSKVEGVLEILVTNYVETPYVVAQVFYDSHQVSRDGGAGKSRGSLLCYPAGG